jgi:hypothetical protein
MRDGLTRRRDPRVGRKSRIACARASRRSETTTLTLLAVETALVAQERIDIEDRDLAAAAPDVTGRRSRAEDAEERRRNEE